MSLRVATTLMMILWAALSVYAGSRSREGGKCDAATDALIRAFLENPNPAIGWTGR